MRLVRVLEIVDAFVEREISLWIGGGWGIDALIGEQTRPHDDLDIAIRAEDEMSALCLLDQMGFRIEEDQDWRPVRVGLRNREGEAIDLHPVSFDESGKGRQDNLEGLPAFGYPPDQLTSAPLDGKAVPCIGPQLQLEFHAGYEPTEKDRKDVMRLCAHFGIPCPPVMGLHQAKPHVPPRR